ncbi:glycosyltransferase family 4 protein [Methyloversatilis sp.]|uniref:glycosyltransferase family 4 protein n=1 Tax=Methyloversatilis sp. TaxID=2569862 RepID=UPI002734BA66|nr:glycosyltransferase [Methyloversatilis sp.]MDP3455947.1 glycosyltransferase [Methyloversatilis sp.]
MKTEEKPRLYVLCRTGNSGLTDYSISLMRKAKRCVDITFVSTQSAIEHPAIGVLSVLPLFRRLRNAPLDLVRVVFRLFSSRPDQVLFQSWMVSPLYDGLIVWCLRLIGIKVAVTAHDLMPHHPKPWSRLTCAFFYRSFDKVIAHSEASVAMLRNFGVQRPILLVPHGEYDLFNTLFLSRADARALLKIDPAKHDHIVLFFGHLDERKGLEEFLNVAARLQDKRVLFLVAGDNNLSSSHQHLVQTTWPENVRIDLGRVPFEHVQRYFSAADVVALPYREGTTSGVLKVAMAFGKPVIASDVGDISETLGFWPGRLISKEALEPELEAALIDCFGLDGTPRSLQTGGQTDERYSWDVISTKYLDFLFEGRVSGAAKE